MFEDRRQKRRRLIIAGLVLLAVSVGAYFFFFTNSEITQTDQSQSVEEALQEVAADQPTNDIRPVSSSNEASFDRPRVDVELPFGWESEERDNSTVWLTSPEFTFQSVSGEDFDGYFRVVLREGVLEQDSDYFGRGLAARESQQITYSDPATGQRPETFVSFFGLDSTDNIGYFFVNGNFNLDVGDSLGADFGDSSAYVISGGYSSPELEDDMATYPVGLDYFDQTNAFDQALSIIESLRIR